jgi:hypothetical protein
MKKIFNLIAAIFIFGCFFTTMTMAADHAGGQLTLISSEPQNITLTSAQMLVANKCFNGMCNNLAPLMIHHISIEKGMTIINIEVDVPAIVADLQIQNQKELSVVFISGSINSSLEMNARGSESFWIEPPFSCEDPEIVEANYLLHQILMMAPHIQNYIYGALVDNPQFSNFAADNLEVSLEPCNATNPITTSIFCQQVAVKIRENSPIFRAVKELKMRKAKATK